MYIMPPERRLEIDDPVDFQVAEVLLQELQQARRLKRLPSQAQALVLDFDGVFTDNKVIVFQDGREAVVCDRGDGHGIAQLKKTGLPILILSTESNPVVKARARKLGLACLNGIADKAAALKKWISDNKIDAAKVIYVGNDINDLGCMEIVGCAVAVADAHPLVLQQAQIVLQHPGGQGALREVCEMLQADFIGRLK
jgi:N-acylneuraminate cytidylyltransferase